jgi:hypothetical protein
MFEISIANQIWWVDHREDVFLSFLLKKDLDLKYIL